jgi:hypothetical protein
MARYTFELLDGAHQISDETGIWFADRERAVEHAQSVARELMQNHELQSRSWRVDVYEEGLCVHELLFASIDPTLDQLRPELRIEVEQACNTVRRFKEALCAAETTMREARALVARSRGKPYLATVAGKPTVRTTPAKSDQRGPAGGGKLV